MTPNLGTPMPADESMHHQTANLMCRVGESDLAWTEKVWLSAPAKDGSLQLDFGLGRYQNRNVMDGFGGVSRGREQWTVRASRELHLDNAATQVGPLKYDVVDPLKKVRFALAENSVQPIAFEVEFTAQHPCFCEDRHLQHDESGFRAVSDVVRFHQSGTIEGWVSVEGKRHEIRQKDWVAFRDRSWGVRLDVGAPPTDIRPARDWGEKGMANANFMLNWSPMIMQTPGGERYEYHYYLLARDHKPYYFSGYRNLADGRQERIARIRPELRFDDRTRKPQGGTLHFDMLSGETRTVEIQVLGDTGFHLGTALYLGFDGKKHGMWMGAQHVEGEKIADTCDDATLRRIHQFRDTPIRIREGDAVGYGIFETQICGAWPEYGLTAETSFV